MEEKHFSENHGEHVEFLPVEWRSKLALDGGECVCVCVCVLVCVRENQCAIYRVSIFLITHEVLFIL